MNVQYQFFCLCLLIGAIFFSGCISVPKKMTKDQYIGMGILIMKDLDGKYYISNETSMTHSFESIRNSHRSYSDAFEVCQMLKFWGLNSEDSKSIRDGYNGVLDPNDRMVPLTKEELSGIIECISAK